jgi:FMN hydrolase / 5-amino-6-(5-phospho-D-ribitylamino)uracil phosphatase
MTDVRWICLDVGETLIDETRIWSTWADELGIPRLTLHAALGAAIARGDTHQDVLADFAADWRDRIPDMERAYGGFQVDDLYPDALPAMAALRAEGYRLAIVANQPAARTAELRAIGVRAEVIAMSDELGVAKPDPGFFARSLELMGGPPPGSVAYVGDRLDNDVVPASAAGMRSVWVRRGPWGVIQALPADGLRPALIVATLAELVDRIGEVWGD